MSKSWELMQVEERARMVLSMFPTLEPDVAQHVIGNWASRDYPDTWQGEQRAMDDLMVMLRDASMSEVQRAQEAARVTAQVEKYLNKEKK